MIEDFTNPHDKFKPTRIEDNPQWTDNKKYRVVQIQGVHTVEAWTGSYWKVVEDQRTKQSNHFQTLQEAENLIAKLKRPSKIYYYE
jgi:hypothetical protein